MSFEDRFSLADDYLEHTDQVMDGVHDDFIKTRYLGFIAISAVTAYELAIKDIIFCFCDHKHRALGELARSRFDRLNGQIKLKDLRSNCVKCFGEKYLKRFDKQLELVESDALKKRRGSAKSSYGNLITWRHNFVHKGEWPATATYRDLRGAYSHGKEVIRCLDKSLVR